MSILNVVLDAQRALICTDSLRGGADERFLCSKVFALPHMRAVIGIRGHFIFATSLFGAMAWTASYEELVDAMPQLMSGITAQLRDTLREENASDDLTQQIALVAWSAADGHPVGRLWVQERDGGIRAGDITAERVVAPRRSIDDWLTVPLDTPDDMARLARRQADVLEKHHPECPVGGPLVFATVTQDGIRLEQRATWT